MNTIHRVLFACALLFVIAGCARQAAPGSAGAHAVAVGPAAAAVTPERALVVTSDVSIRVKDVAAAASKLRDATETAGGWVASGTVSGEGDDQSGQFDLRVPKNARASLRKTIAAAGDVTYESEKIDDVTEQHADLGARLKNARVHEERLLDLMQHKTASVGDLLEAEKELARVRENVEKLEAEQRTLDGSIDYATVRVSITPITSPAYETPGNSVARAWWAGVRGAKAIGVFAMMVIAAVSPTLVPIAATLLALVFLVKRFRRRVA